MRSVLKVILMAFAALLAGCAATGPKYSEAQAGFPAIAAGEARVFFYRDSMMGAALAPDVRVDGRVIAPMKPGSFFFVDVPAGRHAASASTEADSTVDFTAQDGDTVYISMSIGIGLVVGRPQLKVRVASEARQALPSLSYDGARSVARSGAPAAPSAGSEKQPPSAQAPAAPKPQAGRQAAQGGVSMDDLRGLLPPSR
jgi:hypothetical protein